MDEEAMFQPEIKLIIPKMTELLIYKPGALQTATFNALRVLSSLGRHI
jgi:hypothetical protein